MVRNRLGDRLMAVISAAALTLLVAVLIPVWTAHRIITGVRSRRATGQTTRIERISAHSTDLDDVMRRGVPVIIEGLVSEMNLPLTPDLEGLRSLAGTSSGTFTVRRHKAHSPYFLYVGDYGSELDHVDEMDLQGFLDDMFGPEEQRDPDVCTYRLFGVADLNGSVGEIVDSISAALAERSSRRPERQASGIWIGSTGVVTPLHHDAWTGLLFQMTGSKRVLMFPPSERPNLYFTSPLAATDRWSTLPARSDDADPSEFPLYARAHRYEGQLEAGDVLFIPAFWSHEIEALEPNISIPYRFGTRPADQLNPGFLRPAYEIFHRKFVAGSVLDR